ncbi:MAG: DUF99 domain-containing protein [Thermoprotei archaeon]|nr:MAG: DUF99 domain-containing protein [Thermoprotei archaeon]
MVSPHKKGIRCLGIAESFRRDREKSILVGVVMRRDRLIDGIAVTTITVGGLDATDGVLEIFRILDRKDISVVMLNGCIISWFNIIDLNTVYEETKIPLICVTYEESEGIEDYIKRYFPEDYEKRLELYRRLGEREIMYLRNRYPVYVRFLGLEKWEVRALLNNFTFSGRQPEPLKVANFIARAILRSLY